MSIVHWVAVLLVVLLVFGTKKIGNMGADLGKAVKGFKDGVKGEEENPNVGKSALSHVSDNAAIDVEIKGKNKS